ncbi:unnamed protein product [Caenorhabditis sp. 36 PRJEB53466]|nr:unnamed protein product [Caenorhabditis sp. 36 PRJEB53466]
MRKPLLSIGLSQFGLSVLQTLFMFYYVKVYINQFHVNTKWFNVAQTLFMVWNTINDPLFGYLQEVRGSWLNNRFLVIKTLSPFLVVSFVFMWIPWNTKGSDLEGLHLILSLFLYDAFFSAIGVAWGALFADTTQNQPIVRVKALKYSQIAILVSVFSIAVTEKLSLSHLGEKRTERNGEQDDQEILIQEEAGDANLTFKENMKNSICLTKQVISQRQFLAIAVTNFFHTARSIAHMNFASIITEVVIPQDILPSGSVRLSLFFMLLTLGPQIVLIVNEKLIARVGAVKVMVISYLVSFFSGFMIIFSYNPYFTMLFMFIDCITVHTIAPLFNIIISDFVDDDARKNTRSAGIPSIIFSLNALFVKPAQSVAPVLIVHLLNQSGYQEYLKTKISTEDLRNTILLILFMTPAVIGGIQYLVMKTILSFFRFQMLIALTVAADALRPVVPCSLLSLSMVPFASCSLVIGGISWIVPGHMAQKLDNFLYKSYMRLCLFVFENISGVEIFVHGGKEVIKNSGEPENAVVLSNHQTNVDWIIPVILAARHGDQGNEQAFRVMVKQSIHLVPMFGWYIFQHGYIYVRRFGEFIGAPVLRQLKWLNESDPPFWLLIFPEGTRLSPKKKQLIESSNRFLEKAGRPPMRNVLCPRSGGLQLALDNLSTLDAIYDVTVMYGQTRMNNRRGMAPGMFEFCCGPQAHKQLHIHLSRIPIEQVPKEKLELRNWTTDRFTLKERIIDDFYSDSPSAGSTLPCVPISQTLPSAIFFSAALIAPFFSRTIGRVYLLTIASSPLLIAWLHIRRCV